MAGLLTTQTKNDSDSRLPGFRHVLEAALFFGAFAGIADASYIFTRNPDLIADLLMGMRFTTAGSFLSAIAYLLYLFILWLILRPLAVKRKWPLVLSLTILYALAIFPAAALVARTFAQTLAEESRLVAQVKSVYYFLKYLWIIIPVSWAGGVWLARVRTNNEISVLFGRCTAIALSATFFLLLTTFFQQRLLLERANVSSVMTSTRENLVITIAVFAGALILLPIVNLVATRLARMNSGKALIAVWLIGLFLPFIPKFFTAKELVGSPPSGAALSGRSSNVILVSLDTVRYDDLGFNGSEIVETPALDALAEESVVFDNVITPFPMTAPSHMSMLTGLSPSTGVGHGVKSNGMKIDESIPTLATILDEAGYRTGAVIGGFSLSRQGTGLQRGFNYYHDIFNTGLRARFFPDQIWLLTVSKIFRRIFNIREGLPHGRTKSADVVTNQAIRWLDRNSSQPFFLFVHYFDAHYLYAPPPPYDTMYMPDYEGPYRDEAMRQIDLVRQLDTFTEEDFEYFRAMYRGEISFVDNQFSRLVDWLDTNGMFEDTLVIVVSDHGESFEHGYYYDHTDRVYEQLIHVPMMIRDPDARANGVTGERIDTLVNVSDIFFTVLDFLGLEAPATPEEMHEGVMGTVAGWDHDLGGLIDRLGNGDLPDENEDVAQWAFIASQSYSFVAADEEWLGRFFSFRFPETHLIFGPEAPPALPMYQYFDVVNDPDEMNNMYPEINWEEFFLPDAPDALATWASTQEVADLSGVDPAVLEELWALGYLNPGALQDTGSAEQ